MAEYDGRTGLDLVEYVSRSIKNWIQSGHTLYELHEKSGVSNSALSKLLNKETKNPTQATIDRVMSVVRIGLRL